MPTGPNGEKRPPDVIANAVHVMKIATGEIEEDYVKPKKQIGRPPERERAAARASADQPGQETRAAR